MSTAALRAYRGNSVATASPARLLVMLYDRLALDLERAESALRQGDRAGASEQLQHAQEIIIELRVSLDTDAWDGAKGLSGLYGWLLTELVSANITGNVEKVADCRRLVDPLRDTWRQAAAEVAVQ